jgi:uncharacterized protein (TIGR00369 family)
MDAERISLAKELWPEIDRCYGCSGANPSGIAFDGYEVDGEVVGEWSAKEHHAGWPGIVHGGVLATVLDEATGWAATMAFRRRDGVDARPVVTAGYTVQFIAPIRVDERVVVRARVSELGDRKALVEASITSSSGEEAARCSATYVRRDTPMAG